MTTPIYKGQAPAANSGWLGGLGSWFGGVSTPMYAGQGQPSSGSSGVLAGSAPAYKPAPVKPSPAPSPAAPSATTATATTAASTSDASTTPDDPCAMAIPPFAIVIPRDGFEP